MRPNKTRLGIFLPFLHQGGVERAMLNLAEGFIGRQVEVDLIVATRAEGPYVSQIPNGIAVVELGAPRPETSLPFLVRYLVDRRPQALLAALTPANIVAICACRISRLAAKLDVKVAVSVQVSLRLRETTTPFRARLRPLAYRLFFPWADAVVAASKGVAEDLMALGLAPAGIHVIHNPVVTRWTLRRAQEPVGHPWFAPGSPPVVLAVGRFHKQKDFATLLRAFAVVRGLRTVRLVILGEGEERARLEFLRRELGLEADVDMPGFAANPYAYMARSAVFVLSSAWEGFGNVVAEAMACGTPVVSTDCPSGPSEILEGGKWGRLAPVGDAQSLAEAIIQTLDQPRDPVPLRTRAQSFSTEVCVPRYAKAMGIVLQQEMDPYSRAGLTC